MLVVMVVVVVSAYGVKMELSTRVVVVMGQPDIQGGWDLIRGVRLGLDLN